MKLCYFALGAIYSRSSASATLLRWGCLHKVLLLQLPSDGNVFTKFRFQNSALRRKSPFLSSQMECVDEVLLPQLRSGGNVTVKFRFRNSDQKGMSSRSSSILV